LLKGVYLRPPLEMAAFIREIIHQLKRQSWTRRPSNRSRRQILRSALRNRGGLSGRDRLPFKGGTHVWTPKCVILNSENEGHDPDGGFSKPMHFAPLIKAKTAICASERSDYSTDVLGDY
jgi:hypothetical protein